MSVMTLVVPFMLAFAGSLIPAVVLHVERRLLPWVGFCGGAGYLAALLATPGFGIPGYLQVFLGAVVVGLLSESFARVFKTPALTFCIPAIFPLVPGIGAYQTMQLMVSSQWEKAAASGVSTAAATFSIAFGLMLVSAFFRRRGSRPRHTPPPPSGKPF